MMNSYEKTLLSHKISGVRYVLLAFFKYYGNTVFFLKVEPERAITR